jgi:hypothetical protein
VQEENSESLKTYADHAGSPNRFNSPHDRRTQGQGRKAGLHNDVIGCKPLLHQARPLFPFAQDKSVKGARTKDNKPD